MSKYHDDSTHASDPGGIRVSQRKLLRMCSEGKGFKGMFFRFSKRFRQFKEMLDEHLQLGDSRAAMVVSVNPLLVAAYTDELDRVATLRFPDELTREHSLKIGSRLLKINSYARGDELASDLESGPNNHNRFVNLYPVIADFTSDDSEKIEARKREITEDEWSRCLEMGNLHLQTHGGRVRDGSPFLSDVPA